MVWVQKQYTDEWKATESPEIKPYIYGKLIYNKGAKNIQWRKDSHFNKWCLEQLNIYMQKDESRHRLYTFQKN